MLIFLAQIQTFNSFFLFMLRNTKEKRGQKKSGYTVQENVYKRYVPGRHGQIRGGTAKNTIISTESIHTENDIYE